MNIDHSSRLGLVENQMQSPHCIGSAFSALSCFAGECVPSLAIYNYAQQTDEWEGEDYDGTSLSAGRVALETLTGLPIYSVNVSDNDVLKATLQKSPIVISVKGELFAIAGSYHAMIISGYKDGQYKLKNSWGEEWGIGGYVMVKETVLQQHLFPIGYSLHPEINLERKKKRALQFSTLGIIAAGILAVVLAIYLIL